MVVAVGYVECRLAVVCSRMPYCGSHVVACGGGHGKMKSIGDDVEPRWVAEVAKSPSMKIGS